MQNSKILKDQQDILTEVQTYYEQLYGQKKMSKSRLKSIPLWWLVGMTKINRINILVSILNIADLTQEIPNRKKLKNDFKCTY